MFSRAEVVAAIRDATRRTIVTFKPLSERQLAVPVTHGEDGSPWTGREVLAHLAGRALFYQLLIELARSGDRIDAFDQAEFNAIRLQDRIGTPVDDLLLEFWRTHEDLVRQIAFEPAFTRSVRFNGRVMVLSEALLIEAAIHSLEHAASVQWAVNGTARSVKGG